MRHYRGEPVDAALEAKIARYLRRIQSSRWRLAAVSRRRVRYERQRQSLFRAEDDRRSGRRAAYGAARNWILAHGGAANSNVFTRNLLALYGQVPWRAVPVMPVEIMLLPRWFPFHLDKVSYWARTVLVPLMVLNALKPRAVNPRGYRHCRAVQHAAGGRTAMAEGRASDVALGADFRRNRSCLARVTSPIFRRTFAARAIDTAVNLSRSG